MRRILAIMICLSATQPAQGQVRSASPSSANAEAEEEQQLRESQLRPAQPGRVAESAVGEVGQRQTRDQVASGIRPTARLANRIQNRIQSRIRNRIDRDYDPQADAASPFENAEGQARIAGRPDR